MIKVRAKMNGSPDYMEIGQAEFLDFSEKGGAHYRFQDFHLEQEIVQLIDWQVPVEDPMKAFGLHSLGTSKDQEIQNLETIITVLVNMMGGAVTIGKSEADESLKYKLTNEMQRDPLMFILRTEPKLYIP